MASKKDLLEKAKALGIDGADDMTAAQLTVAIEEIEQPVITINVPNRVVTPRGIVVEAGTFELPPHELAATGLLPHQYKTVEPKADEK